jgi:hypothetical protein
MIRALLGYSFCLELAVSWYSTLLPYSLISSRDLVRKSSCAGDTAFISLAYLLHKRPSNVLQALREVWRRAGMVRPVFAYLRCTTTV